jgi:tricarballylate dehydrogenase
VGTRSTTQDSSLTLVANSPTQFDVIVVGGGNAALCAALAARKLTPSVLLLERAPAHMRGGNTRHTRNIRCASVGNGDRSQEYRVEEFLDDLIGVTGGPANLDLAKFAIQQSQSLPQWMSEHGILWQPPLAGTLHLGRTNRWFLGGGKSLVNAYYDALARMGIAVRYDADVVDLLIEDGEFRAVTLKIGDDHEAIRGRAVVVAAGGFEANIEWLKRYWGDAADNFLVRGTPYNDGTMLANLITKDAKQIGDPKAFHAIAVDGRAPKFDGGIVTRLDSIPFGVVVNRFGQRFYDEGEDIWPKRYAIWGRLIAEQPEQIAYSIVDAKTIRCFLPPVYKPYQADSLEDLAGLLKLEAAPFLETIQNFNRATAGNLESTLERLDGVKTRGLTPPKSNWALPIDRAPFYGLPLRPGITFTYMGVEVDSNARVIQSGGRPFSNVYAAGEIMSGNILTKGYLAGFGLTIGSVFGRLAGKEAASHAGR